MSSKLDDNLTYSSEFGRSDYGSTPVTEAPSSMGAADQTSRFCPLARRYYVALMAFFGFCNVYAMRVNLSVAIIDMMKNHTYHLSNGTTVEIPAQFSHWNSVDQGIVLSSFFYGYIFTQIPGGWLACKIGGKLLLGIGVSASAILALLTPPAAHMGYGLFVTVRVLQGLFQGVAYPSMHAVWSHWAPPQEKTKLASFAVSGSYFGTVVALPISASLVDAFGWTSVFYFFGVIALVWSAFWILTVSETPSTDPKISKNEHQYILTSLGFTFEQVQLLHEDACEEDFLPSFRLKSRKFTSTFKTPWKSILTSAPVWAIVVSHFSENWFFYIMLTNLPKFLNSVYNFSVEQTGFLAALPFLVLGILIQFAGYLADYLRTERKVKTIVVRKVFNCAGLLCQAIFTLAAAHALSPSVAVACIVIAVGVGGFVWSAFAVNQLDIAPQYAGILMGLSNCIATLPGIIGPSVVGALVKREHSLKEWQTVFYISVAVYIFGMAVYAVFARADRQKWAEVPGGQVTALDDEFSKDLDPANESLD